MSKQYRGYLTQHLGYIVSRSRLGEGPTDIAKQLYHCFGVRTAWGSERPSTQDIPSLAASVSVVLKKELSRISAEQAAEQSRKAAEELRQAADEARKVRSSTGWQVWTPQMQAQEMSLEFQPFPSHHY